MGSGSGDVIAKTCVFAQGHNWFEADTFGGTYKRNERFLLQPLQVGSFLPVNRMFRATGIC